MERALEAAEINLSAPFSLARRRTEAPEAAESLTVPVSTTGLRFAAPFRFAGPLIEALEAAEQMRRCSRARCSRSRPGRAEAPSRWPPRSRPHRGTRSRRCRQSSSSYPKSPGQALGAGTVRSWKILHFDVIVVSVVMVGVVVAFVGVWSMAGLSEPMRVCRVGPH